MSFEKFFTKEKGISTDEMQKDRNGFLKISRAAEIADYFVKNHRS